MSMGLRASDPSTQRISPTVVVLLSVALAAVGLATLLLPVSPVVLLSALALLVFAALLVVFRGRMAPLALSPLTIVTGGLLIVGALGSISFANFSTATYGSSAEINLSDETTVDTLQLMILAAATIFGSGLLVLCVLPKLKRPDPVNAQQLISPRLYPWLLLAATIPLVTLLVTSGRELIERDRYIDSVVSNSPIVSLMNQLAVAAVIILGFLIASRRGPMRFAAIGLFVGYLAIFAGGGSRTMAMALPLLVLGAFAAKRSRGMLIALLASLVAAFFLVQLSLYFRTLPRHGLMPYLASLGGFSESGVGLADVSLNLLFSFGIIGATAFQSGQLVPTSFWISVNPLPGDSAGWYDVAESLRLNVNTPFAGIGELGNYGTSYLIGYCIVVGVILAYFERQSIGLLNRGMGSLALVPLGLSGLFLLYAMQYNLRSSTRLLVYGLVITLVMQVVVSILSRRPALARRRT